MERNQSISCVRWNGINHQPYGLPVAHLRAKYGSHSLTNNYFHLLATENAAFGCTKRGLTSLRLQDGGVDDGDLEAVVAVDSFALRQHAAEGGRPVGVGREAAREQEQGHH